MNEKFNYSDARKWQPDDSRALYWAIALALPVAIVGFRYLMRGGPLLFIVVFALLIFILYQILTAATPPSLTKAFYVPREDAEQIVENVLAEKKFPYEWRNGRFQLDGIQIIVKTRRQLTLSEDGCLIRISPNTPENDPLITSLCTKIDDAFAPKGLSD